MSKPKVKSAPRPVNHDDEAAPSTERSRELPIDVAVMAWRMRALEHLEELRRTMPAGVRGFEVELTSTGLRVGW